MSSVEVARPAAYAATSSASRCTVEIVEAMVSSIRLKERSRMPISPATVPGARTARSPCSASSITWRISRTRAASSAGVRTSTTVTTPMRMAVR